MAWDPQQYLTYHDHRLRPGMDLLARIPVTAPQRVVDLGCGPGTLTLALADAWPEAEIAGIDSDDAMLTSAATRDERRRVSWLPGDLKSWTAAHRVDVIYSNSALHWVDDHPQVLIRWLRQLAPGGVIAVQMPDTAEEPMRRVVAQVIEDGPWATRLRPLLLGSTVLPARRYHQLLAPIVNHLDVWATTYWQALTGPDPVLEWLKGSLLVPVRAALNAAEDRDFLDRLAARLREVYPSDERGVTLLEYPRLFLLAQR